MGHAKEEGGHAASARANKTPRTALGILSTPGPACPPEPGAGWVERAERAESSAPSCPQLQALFLTAGQQFYHQHCVSDGVAAAAGPAELLTLGRYHTRHLLWKEKRRLRQCLGLGALRAGLQEGEECAPDPLGTVLAHGRRGVAHSKSLGLDKLFSGPSQVPGEPTDGSFTYYLANNLQPYFLDPDVGE